MDTEQEGNNVTNQERLSKCR